MKTTFSAIVTTMSLLLAVLSVDAQTSDPFVPSSTTAASANALPARSFWNTGALALRSNRTAFAKSMLNCPTWRGAITNTPRTAADFPRVVDAQVAERGPHHKVVRTVRSMIMPDGTTALRTNSYVQLENGMHYLEHGEWKESVAEIEAFPGGAIARHGAHKVIFANNLNTVGAVDLEMPDGQRLRSRVVGLSYFDASSGQAVLIAETQDSLGQLVPPDRVVYTNAFKGVLADLEYVYSKDGLEQNVILRAAPPLPSDFKLNPATTRLQAITEFFDPPSVAKTTAAAEAGELADETIRFQKMELGRGRAFKLGAAEEDDAAVKVTKQWLQRDGRTFLVEQVPFPKVSEQLKSLGLSPSGAFYQPRSRGKGEQVIAALGPTLPTLPGRTAADKQALMAKASSRPESGFVLDYVVVTSQSNYRFQGDTTYYVVGAVTLSGTTIFEGGAVVKFAPGMLARITCTGTVDCQTGPYRPAVFTARDDDVLGETLDVSTHTISGKYGNGLVLNSNSALKHLRFCFANSALTIAYSSAQIEWSNLQIVNCLYAVDCYYQGDDTITLNNSLISGVTNVIRRGYDNYVEGIHLTVNGCNKLFSAQGSGSGEFHATNSVFANVGTLGNADVYDGSHNGFFSSFYNTTFGDSPVSETESPFAPTGPAPGVFYLANGQGADYLREGSLFLDAGTTEIPTTLKDDLAHKTTVVPEFLAEDINSSMTLAPTAVRDSDTPDLGYHYAVVDYVINGVTVNNCTLNIDQGTILAYEGWPYLWGIRLNPGGRLNVNGVPTNRVVFARLEAVQEAPVFDLEAQGPTITWRELYFPSGPPTPYPEVRLRYADFPTLVGGRNGHLDASSEYLAFSYSIIANLELEGCHFQGGWVAYDDGGPPGRELVVRNTVFERTHFIAGNWGGYEFYFDAIPHSAQVAVTNNLFYYCYTFLYPVDGQNRGSTWTIVDNIFDHVSFDWGWGGYANGPVGVNDHNAYIGMASIPDGGNRLTPTAPTSTDPDLTTLNYDPGPLGRFYLPASATTLLHADSSRLAAVAGQYHFTSLASNAKEADNQLSIGPHYLALVDGGAADSNGDGVPDFIADGNGDGIEQTDETLWFNAPNGSLGILSPTANATLGGVLRLRVNLGINAAEISAITALVDGQPLRDTVGVSGPAQSVAELQLNTAYLADGVHTLMIAAARRNSDSDFSDSVSITTDNGLCHPDWHDRAEIGLEVNLQAPVSVGDYTLYFFNAAYPKADDIRRWVSHLIKTPAARQVKPYL